MRAQSTRRSFLGGLAMLLGAGPLAAAGSDSEQTPAATSGPGVGDLFPATDPELVQALVTVSHSDVVEVRRLVERRPSLARASWDWGFGDWETGLGAASHTGRREIAEVLLAHGARPTIFSTAMMGQLDVVKTFIAARPGVQRTLGPHGLTLLSHARAGGADAAAVVAYLESVGDADVRPATQPLAAGDRDAVVGRYVFGPGARDVFEVDVRNDQLGILRPGGTRRILFHTGELVFFPSGVPSVKIAFARQGAHVTQLTVADPDVLVTARRGA